jgi:hypothetical protein
MFNFVPVSFWEPYFKHRENLLAKTIMSLPENTHKCHEIVRHAWQSIHRKKLRFFFYFFYVNDPGISWEYKLWSESVSSAEVWNAGCCCSSWVQDGFEEESLRQRHRKRTHFRLSLMPTYLRMTFLHEVTMTIKRTTEKTQAAHTGLTHWTDTTQSWTSAPVILHL